MSILALATAQTIQGAFNGLKVTQIALQAQQYADAKVNLIKAAGFEQIYRRTKKIQFQNRHFIRKYQK